MRYLIAPAIAWLAAQGLKHIFHLFGKNRRIFARNPRSGLFLSGGMPSAHSATVTALTLMIGLGEGWSSPLFALSFLFASVVMYDAMMVRYSSGRQGDRLNQLLDEIHSRLSPVRVAHGHTMFEVVCGAAIGIVVAYVVFSTSIF